MRRISWFRFGWLALSAIVGGLIAADTPPPAARNEAYELHAQKRLPEAAEAFRRYLATNPDDLPASLDYASLLVQLKRPAEAAQVLERIHQKFPRNEAAYFRLGAVYVELGRTTEAANVFGELESSPNADIAAAAAEAARRLRHDLARAERQRAEQAVFALAEKFEHEKVIAAVNELEQAGPVSLPLEVQRLYALASLGRYAPALERANQLAPAHPSSTSLALLRADLYAQLGRRQEANELWRQVEREHTGTPAAAEAARRLQASEAWAAEEHVYALVRERKHREALAAIVDLEQTGPLSFAMEMQRLHALQALDRPRQAIVRSAALAERHPQSAELALFRADLLARQNRWPEAEAILKQVVADHANTPAAFEAEKRLREEEARRNRDRDNRRSRAEAAIFELARRQQHREVIAAIDALEREGGELPWIFQMQRLYALQALGERERALAQADRLAAQKPGATDLALFRGYLLAELGRRDEATALFRKIQQEQPGTAAAEAATRQLAAFARAEAAPPAEARIYELAGQHQHREAIAAIDELEKQGPLSLTLGMQRLYALQALGETERAAREAERLAQANPDSAELGLLRADLLIHAQQWEAASRLLKQLKDGHPDTPIAAEAQRRLRVLPPIANLDKWYWGEAYNAGTYHGRYGTVIGSGFARHGWFIPRARWFQPYAELRYSVDTRSGVGPRQSIIADNFVGLYFGARVQPLPTEYLFVYAQGGFNTDLLGRRADGDWVWDYQAGLYGFKSWGPGVVLLSARPGEAVATTGNVPLAGQEPRPGPAAESPRPSAGFFWRGDWFVDAGADFSYYHRHGSWIGYAQAHEGFRLFQFGPRAAVDAYLVENASWDIRGNFFDNLFELGPGARVLWVPRGGWEVILRAEYVNGFYFGRDERDNRNGADSRYDDVRVGLSVGTRW